MLIEELYTPEQDDPAQWAMHKNKFMPTGFPSPAASYMGDSINLNDFLNIRSASCFLARVSGNGMMKAGIHSGDLVVIDRSLPVEDQCLVLAALNEEYVVRRYCKEAGKQTLKTEEDTLAITELKPGDELVIWGVISWVIHRCLPEGKKRLLSFSKGGKAGKCPDA